MNDEGIAEQLQRALKRLVIATVVLYLGLMAVFFYGYNNAAGREELERVARSVNGALCALREDYAVRVTRGEEFLRDNPDGIPGITASTIQAGIEQDQRTVAALSGLDC